MKKTIILTFTAALALFIISSCSKGSGGGGGGGTTVNCSAVTNKAFNADVLPIILASCAIAGCHAAGSTNGPGALTNHREVFGARSSIRSAVSSGQMPKNSSLSTSQKNSIICWIDSGAPNN